MLKKYLRMKKIVSIAIAISMISIFQMSVEPLNAADNEKIINKIEDFREKQEKLNSEPKKDYSLNPEEFKNQTDENTIYDFEKLEEMRKKADIQAKVHEVNIKMYEKELEDVMKLADIEDYGGNDRVTMLNRKKTIYSNPMEAQEKVDNEKRLKDYEAKQQKIDLEYNLAKTLIVLNENQYAKKEYEYAKKTETIDKLKYELGKKTLLEYLESQNKTSEMKNKLSEAKDNVSKEFIELKRMVGVEPYAPLMTSYELNIKDVLPEFIQDRVKSIVLNQNQVKHKKALMEVKNTIFKSTAIFYRDFDKEYIIAEADYKMALMDYNDAYNSTIIDFTAKREDALVKYDKYKLAKANYELKTNVLKNSKLEYKLGRISKLDLSKVELDVEKANLEYLKSIAEYNKIYDELILMSTFQSI